MNIRTRIEQLETPLQHCVVCYFIRGDEVLLGLRKEVTNDLGLNLVSGIGGKVEPGEENVAAMVRESIEEIGEVVIGDQKQVVCKPTKWESRGNVNFLFPNKPKWNQTVDVYVVTEWEGDPVETRAIKPEWYPINNLPVDQMWADNAIWVPQVLAGGTVNASYMYADDNKSIAEWEEV